MPVSCTLRPRWPGLALVLGLLLTSPTWATETDAPLQRFLEHLKTLQADFVQTVSTADGRSQRTSRGRFYLSRPGRFRWDYSDPQGQIVVADGGRVWLYDPELSQVSHQSQEEALRGTPALLLSDTSPIERHFEVMSLRGQDELTWVELTPRAENTEIIRVRLAFQQERLERLEMLDSFGQLTRFQFNQVLRNPKLDPALFRFVPPPDVDLLQR